MEAIDHNPTAAELEQAVATIEAGLHVQPPAEAPVVAPDPAPEPPAASSEIPLGPTHVGP